MKDLKVAITLAAGRPRVIPVLESFIKNAKKYGHNTNNFSIYISIDTDYKNIPFEEFIVTNYIKENTKKIELLSKKDRQNIAKRAYEQYNIKENIAKIMFSEKGYSSLRNCVLLRALEDENDHAIFFDDDEYPIIPIANENKIEWCEPDFFGPHLHALKQDVDITRGPYLGYISPVPSDFDEKLPLELRKALGQALSHGSEIIRADTFMNVMNANLKILPKQNLLKNFTYEEVLEGKYGKEILTGNMAINLNSVRKGKIPLFFTPPQARGEDAIFAIQLRDVKVAEVNSYIFHDPFNMYANILNGEKPSQLQPVTSDENSVNRFVSALTGWLKYAPILVKMTSNDEDESKYRTKKMMFEIEKPSKELARILDDPRIATCNYTLKKYFSTAEQDHRRLYDVQTAWKNNIITKINRQRTITA